jgi:hypothetical protein
MMEKKKDFLSHIPQPHLSVKSTKSNNELLKTGKFLLVVSVALLVGVGIYSLDSSHKKNTKKVTI